MKHTETHERFHQELPCVTEVGSCESGDPHFVYHETAYLHNQTGELWLVTTRLGRGGGGTFYERYDTKPEIGEILKRCQ